MRPAQPIMRVFISSTFQDLQTEREAASRAIHSLDAYSDDMIYWSADPRDGATHSIDRVKQSNLLILILAHRYGYIAPGQTISVTEQEYQTAIQHKIPVLAFFLDDTVPWPPAFVETERAAELAAFKRTVEQAVTRKLFKSPDQLEVLISQALFAFVERFRGQHEEIHELNAYAIDLASPGEIKTVPDPALHIGQDIDGLPLILQITRSEDLSYPFRDMQYLVERYNAGTLNGLLATFRQELEFQAGQVWAQKSVQAVRMKDGSRQEMYVTGRTLSYLFKSTLSSLLRFRPAAPPANSFGAPVPPPPPPPLAYDDNEPITSIRPVGSGSYAPPPPPVYDGAEQYDDIGTQIPAFGEGTDGSAPELESAGGRNRFLGVSLSSGRVYSVGLKGGEWVEWRPFYSEVISPAIDAVQVRVENQLIPLQQYETHLANWLRRNRHQLHQLTLPTALIVSRQSLARLIGRIGREVWELHRQKMVHGDLKPKNVLLTAEGVQLIDLFDLKVGDIAPGWTINWSAPEQALGEPVSAASDVYPLGKMLAELIQAKLVGEIRLFSVPFSAEPEGLHINPSLFLDDSETILGAKDSRAAWRAFLATCLRFTPAERPVDGATFADQLDVLLAKYPLQGQVELPLPNNLILARMAHGAVNLARVIEDGGG